MTNHNFLPDQALFQQLQQLKKELPPLSDLFEEQPERGATLTLRVAGLYLDYSKNLINQKVLNLLERQTEQSDLKVAIHSLFSGELVNLSEQRPALHTALRDNPPDNPYASEVNAGMTELQKLVGAIHQEKLLGATGKPFKNIVNIGIGGSDLGPRLVVDALRDYRIKTVQTHFIANIDPNDFADTVANLDPETTLFIICSKSFSTLETLENSKLAKAWLTASINAPLENHFIAVTANETAAIDFGISPTNILPMWDWVGGRFSLWSCIGAIIPMAIGWENFQAFQQGAASMDQHYKNAPALENMPTLLALLECWYINHWQARSVAVLPYSHRLRLFPAYLQQLSMESLGKHVSRTGEALSHSTGAVVWGTEGSNGQHSFHQLLHQGTIFIPVDFIAVCEHDDDATQEQHQQLLANCFAQSKVLMDGKSEQRLIDELVESGLSEQNAMELAQHKHLAGSRPSNTLLLDKLSPASLGALLALYEHKIHAQSILWDINAFDQWGVETGKKIGQQLFRQMTEKALDSKLDSSTQNLIKTLKQSNSEA